MVIFYNLLYFVSSMIIRKWKGVDMIATNYDKYANMSRRQLLNSLLNAEKKEQKIKADLNANKELIKFLKSKMKESLDSPKYEFATREQSGLDKIANELKSQMSKQEQERLKIEIEQEISRDYSNEL